MSKQKRLVSFNDRHFEMLSQMMQEDGQESFSFVLGTLISKEYKERLEMKNKRPQGRPKKTIGESNEEDDSDEPDFSDDLPKNKPYFNQMVGARELHYLENRKIEMPPK